MTTTLRRPTPTTKSMRDLELEKAFEAHGHQVVSYDSTHLTFRKTGQRLTATPPQVRQLLTRLLLNAPARPQPAATALRLDTALERSITNLLVIASRLHRAGHRDVWARIDPADLPADGPGDSDARAS